MTPMPASNGLPPSSRTRFKVTTSPARKFLAPIHMGSMISLATLDLSMSGLTMTLENLRWQAFEVDGTMMKGRFNAGNYRNSYYLNSY